MKALNVDWENELCNDTWKFVTREELVRKYGVYEDDHNPSGVKDLEGYPHSGKAYLFGKGKLDSEKIIELTDTFGCIVAFNTKDKQQYLVPESGDVIVEKIGKGIYCFHNTGTGEKIATVLIAEAEAI